MRRRGGVCCAVATCSNMYYKTKGEIEISYHRFPKDENIKKLWWNLCNRDDNCSSDNMHVCSLHFTEDDYLRNMQSELGFGKKRKLLKSGAVPSKRLSLSSCIIPAIKKGRRRAVKKIKCEIEEDVSVPSPKEVNEGAIQVNSPCRDDEYSDLKTKYEQLLEEHEDLKKTTQEKIDALNLSLNSINKPVERRVTEILSSFLTSDQIDLLLRSKKTKQLKDWSCDDLSRALTIRYLSRKCYVYLRDQLHYPLPSLFALKKWATNMNFNPVGILSDVLRLMKVAGSNFSSQERITVLSFSHMKIERNLDSDDQYDLLVGSNNCMLTVMAKGLFSDWKQPVYVKFNTEMTGVILQEIIIRLVEVGYDVVSVVCDSASGSLSDIGVSPARPYFSSLTGRMIYCFAETNRLLRSLRNHLLEEGYVMNNGNLVTAGPLLQLIKNNRYLVTNKYKLTEQHLRSNITHRLNNKLAQQLLSRSTVTALQQLPEDCLNLCNFIELVSYWYSIFNSYSLFKKLPQTAAYGLFLGEQEQKLDEFRDMVLSMRIVGQQDLMPFQSEIAMNILSLKNLYEGVKEQYDITYVLTNKLNPYSLKNLFSQIRRKCGTTDCVTPVNVMFFLRLAILGKITAVSKNIDARTTEKAFIVEKVLKKSGVPVEVEEEKLENPVIFLCD